MQITFYKDAKATKSAKKVNLKGAKIISENAEDPADFRIGLKTGRIIAFDHLAPEQRAEFEEMFNVNQGEVSPTKKSAFKRFKQGFIYVVKAPIKLGSGTIGVLEKISDGFRKTPNAIFQSPEKPNKKTKKVPKGAAHGLYMGTESIVTEVFGAIAGIVTEPYKGGKQNGIKGVISGAGRGIVGLIFKPVAGSIDLVTQTARGMGTVPRTIYKNLFKIKRKGVKEDSSPKGEDKANMQLVFEDDQGAVYVNKEVLAGELEPKELTVNYKGQAKSIDLEEDKRRKLTHIMAQVIDHLDVDENNKHIKVLNPPVDLEEAQEEQPDIDQEITKILNLNTDDLNESEEQQENELMEIFYVNGSKDPNLRRASVFSMQTNSFEDQPREKFVFLKFGDLNKEVIDEKEISLTESYNSDYAVNKGIPIDDSVEIDVDEYKNDELKLDFFLAMHTGREGRNGPDNRGSLTTRPDQGLSPLENILALLGEENEINMEPDFVIERQITGQASDKEVIRTFSRLTSNVGNFADKKRGSIFSKSISLIKPLNLNNMEDLMEDPLTLDKKLKNWKYPSVLEDLAWQELPDLPDLIRASDYLPSVKVYNTKSGVELAKYLEEWTYHPEKDDVRFPYTHKNGGKVPENDIIPKKMRKIGKDFITKVGRQVLSGNFNLAAVPFPIKATIPRSYLENVGVAPSAYFPLYMNLAMRSREALERFKFYIIGTIAYFFMTVPFSKPFNPIIGETYTGHYNDGGRVYLEQISHHPPVSYMLYYGPHEAYRIWGPTMFSANAGLNSMKLITKGWRKIQFADTQQMISNTFPNEAYEGLFWGTNTAETVGDMEFVDTENELYCKITFGGVKKKPSDYVKGTITYKNKPAGEISGTCLGWLEIDGQRYFDYRYTLPFLLEQGKSPLLSDFRYRPDYLYLKNGYLDNAQKHKDELEQLQRADGKLRKENKEKTEKGKKGK